MVYDFVEKTSKVEWLEKNGFSKDGYTYLIGGDTYKNKEKIKAIGGKYNRPLKWHIDKDTNLKEYITKRFSFDELYIWDEKNNKAIPKSNLEEIIHSFDAEVAAHSLSQFYGTIGERVRNVAAVYLETASFDSYYGIKFIHKFKINDDLLYWFTASPINLEENTNILLTGTIKSHEVYQYKNVTYLSRCIIKKA
jgi:hypothetical protein